MAEQTNLQDVQPHSSGTAVKPESASTEDQKHVNVQDGGREPLLQTMPSSTFNHNDPKYMCCCGCMHVKNGAIVIGIISWVVLFLDLAVHASNSQYERWARVSMITFSLLHVPFIICLLAGAIIKNHILVLIYTIYGCFRMALYALIVLGLLVIMILGLTGQIAVKYKAFFGILFGIGISAVCIEIAIAAWWTWVAFKCFRYLRDLKQQNGLMAGNEP